MYIVTDNTREDAAGVVGSLCVVVVVCGVVGVVVVVGVEGEEAVKC
jgi:hypothetical protein